ncbi:MAG: hypothetical protein VX589_02325 [Myxococcota bacterium]|nr:hypothetical protein [Myxococcota bacterium]
MKAIRAICLLGVIGLGVFWYTEGMHLATLEEKLVETTKVDDFGDEVTEKSWVKVNEIGLDYLGPAAGLLFGIAVVITIKLRRRS